MKKEIHRAWQGARDMEKISRKIGVKACCGID
jgi:bacterioferritin-associated ferredoxin